MTAITTIADLAPALLATMLDLAPPATHADRDWGSETEAEVVARYSAHALDVAAIVLDPEERPIRGLDRIGTAAVLIGMGYGETRFAADVVDPDGCYREGAWFTRCDSGAAAGYGQVHFALHGLTRAEAVGEEGTRIALRALRSSVARCWHLEPEYRLSAYGTGDRCVRLEEAKKRFASVQRATRVLRVEIQRRREGPWDRR